MICYRKNELFEHNCTSEIVPQYIITYVRIAINVLCKLSEMELVLVLLVASLSNLMQAGFMTFLIFTFYGSYNNN